MMDPNDAQGLWYKTCVENACRYPPRSFGHWFWWGCRLQLADPESIRLWANNPVEANKNWIEYLAYKLDQFPLLAKGTECSQKLAKRKAKLARRQRAFHKGRK